MDLSTLKSWLDAYGRAWEARSPEMAEVLFTEDASYQEPPYDKPMRGRSAIVEYWSHVPRTQEDIHFNYEIIALTIDVAIIHWTASFTRIASRAKVKLDGIFLLNFESNHCRSLREWWVRHQA
jgi:hypothetical protein